MKTIVVMGTLDTKGPQIKYLKEQIEKRGHRVILMDLSMGSDSPFKADITPGEILARVGKDLKEVQRSRDRFFVNQAMTEGAKAVLMEFLAKKELDGVIAVGGTTMATVASPALHALPLGIPKVIGCPGAQPAYVKEWFDASDIVIMQAIMDFAHSNDFVMHNLELLAGIICGMVENQRPYDSIKLPYPSVAITELGFCPACAKEVHRLLEEKGFHVISFHAQGISDRAMDKLIGQGLFDGLIDICPAGLIEEALKGNRAAGFERLDAPLERGIPVVLAPCCLNLTGCGPTRFEWEKYASREKVLKIDALRSMTRLNKEELLLCAKLYAEKLNKAKGKVRFLIPLKGFSAIDKPGTILYDPQEDRILIDELKRLVTNPKVEFIEMDCNLEDPEFALALVQNFEELFKEGGK
jgi:uncharacterized protein (UPF0261 family)